MIRRLIVIAIAAFLVSAASFAGAYAIGGLDPWRNGFFNVSVHDDDPFDHDDGPQASRTLTWAGGDSLQLDLGGEVTYLVGATPSIVVKGPKALVDAVQMEGGRLWSDHENYRGRDGLRIVVTAPAVSRFEINGSADLDIQGYAQPDFELTINGSGDVRAAGTARNAVVRIAGSGDVDLEGLTLENADIEIAGSGSAVAGPTVSGKVAIAGSGDVRLTNRPPALTTDVAGSGDIEFD